MLNFQKLLNPRLRCYLGILKILIYIFCGFVGFFSFLRVLADKDPRRAASPSVLFYIYSIMNL